MSLSGDILDRLVQARALHWRAVCATELQALCGEAADEIKRLREVREALEGLLRLGDTDYYHPDSLYAGAVQRARVALERAP